MGTVLSNIEELDRLYFRPFPTTPKAGLRIVRVDHMLVGVDKDDRLYCTGAPAQKFAYTASNWPWIGDLLTALVRLKVVDQAVMDQHIENVREREKRRDARYVLDHDLVELERDYGVRLTTAQRRKIEKVAGR